MALNKKEIRKKHKDIDIFMKKEAGKHKCGCGCNQVIDLKKSHFWNGIPAYIFDHAARLRRGVKKYDTTKYYSAEIANVSDQTVRLWNRSNKIVATKTIGRKNLYDKTHIQDFLHHRPARMSFTENEYYTIQELKQMGISRSKLRILVRAGKIQEPRHHSRKTHYLKTEINEFQNQILEDQKPKQKRQRISKTAFTNVLNRVNELEERIKMLEDCMLDG